MENESSKSGCNTGIKQLQGLVDNINQLTQEEAESTWVELPWKKIENQVFKLQKRIYRASLSGDTKLVHRLQKLITKSWCAKLLAIRRVTQDNKGKKTAGIDGIKSLNPKERFELIEHLRLDGKSNPTRRVWIPKPGKKEMRPLGIPTMLDRAKQALLKMALEPEWEAKFEPNSYGFRPGRSCHDAIEAINISINRKPKFVLDADISKCFDRIKHTALIKKINTFPIFSRQIKAWLKSGVIDFSKWAERKGLSPTSEGTPQGGVISPLLANIALHGMEQRIEQEFPGDKNGILRINKKRIKVPRLIRYADDFVILCEELSIIQRCKEVIEIWLKDVGLELKPSKTRLAHTLEEWGGEKPGFNFLGFNIRQFKKGRHHTGKNPRGGLLGFKTLISPSKENILRHYKKLDEWLDKHKTVAATKLITELNPIIRGWCNYQSPWNSKYSFNILTNLMWNRIWRWVSRRHPKKSGKWIKEKYFQTHRQDNWIVSAGNKNNPLTLLKHRNFPAGVRWTKVQGERTPYDGDEIYWSKRIGDKYLTIDPQKSRLLKKQKGRCAYCEQQFNPDDLIEKHHIERKSKGGSNADKNLLLVHLHCHDQIHHEKMTV